MSEVFFWGVLPEDREKRVEELYENVIKPINEKNIVESNSAEERLKKYREEILSNMSEDERAYYLVKERFEDETEEIRNRYETKIFDEIHKQYIQVIKEEYKATL